MKDNQQDCSLSIELLPEFGWSIKDTPAYGPGSVFQGHVKLQLVKDIPIESIRLVFYAIERVPPYDIHFGAVRTIKNTLFSIQYTLWDHNKDRVLNLEEDRSTDFPFTIQMPMVQFPPTFNHILYQCNFQLMAIVNTSSGMIKHEQPVICMPFVETRLLKTPLMLSAGKSNLTAQLKMTATDFVPGDLIPLTLHVGSLSPNKKTQYVTVQLKLIQSVNVKVFDDMPCTDNIIASASHKLLLIPTPSGSFCDGELTLQLPPDLTPSCEYGKIANVTYRLQVSVEQKGPMGGIWSYFANFEDIPVIVGTLGYGIRVSDEFTTYDQYQLNGEGRLVDIPVPKFMKSIEYEDALPLYDSTRLPDYDAACTPLMIC
ncbi:hypothetical protein G6F70_007330 [Rhizopus microsporus]|uniref:Arrestin C-terminal-like domain-containing protein n=2 Tax=Rhizopus TaxID=4842 RepID=A0A367JT76_RHIAZ|nr:hypothetical protein G6F71_004772 [Rhizopus microsporus]RCH93143.1 hypothetical protein CU097_012034 [Rhizopus azygosporus]KAG1196591.1 hypothetical protein G6F70_007330 [Rhizopus microsporus]KAG1208323.1 hypothetical protein G6F69_007321 [Rhizopus microsporus]KAG1228779.1 hypothetical protein G6F67_007600 [Rhizopus microsporus]